MMMEIKHNMESKTYDMFIIYVRPTRIISTYSMIVSFLIYILLDGTTLVTIISGVLSNILYLFDIVHLTRNELIRGIVSIEFIAIVISIATSFLYTYTTLQQITVIIVLVCSIWDSFVADFRIYKDRLDILFKTAIPVIIYCLILKTLLITGNNNFRNDPINVNFNTTNFLSMSLDTNLSIKLNTILKWIKKTNIDNSSIMSKNDHDCIVSDSVMKPP
jgi:hypothetical protein